MTLSGLDRIGDPLRAMLREREIIARCELLNRTYDLVRSAHLSPSEKEELQKLVGKKIESGVFSNILSGTPIFFDLPKLDAYTLLNGRIFHFIHTQKYGKQDFEKAFSRFQASMPELRTMLRQNMADLLAGLMIDAGYSLVDGASRRLGFEASGRKADCIIYTSIRSINLDESDCILLVPSDENLDPFMQFFREKGAAAEESGLQIWVANLEQGSIDPFIGYTTDMDIYKQFRNPRLAQMVRSTWGISR